MKRKFLLICSMVLLLGMILAPMPVKAHTPISMTLEYNPDTDILTVTVSHSVSGDHRIAQIEVWKNDVSQTVRTYDPPQETTTGMDDTFTITAEDGDVLKATATCSVSGAITREISVGSTTATSTSSTDSPTGGGEALDSNLLLYAGIAAVGLIVIVLVVCIRKR